MAQELMSEDDISRLLDFIYSVKRFTPKRGHLVWSYIHGSIDVLNRFAMPMLIQIMSDPTFREHCIIAVGWMDVIRKFHGGESSLLVGRGQSLLAPDAGLYMCPARSSMLAVHTTKGQKPTIAERTLLHIISTSDSFGPHDWNSP